MVADEVDKRKAVEKGDTKLAKKARPRANKARKIVGVVISCILLFASAALLIYAITLTLKPEEEPAVSEIEVEVVEILPPAVEWQSTVDAWAAKTDGNKSIYIYGLDRDEEVASYNVDESYNTASLYKLFVVYEGYKRVYNGEWDGNARIYGNYTILDCLDKAIRESYSPCAERMWAMIGADTLDAIMESEWGIVNSDISRLSSNALDIYRIMRRFFEHPDFEGEALIARMWDSFLNQPPSAGLCTGPCNWRQGLPSGFSDAVEVYNKVGWAYGNRRWDIYHDAAILHFKETDRNFIIVVMTNYVDFSAIRELATMLEQTI